MILAEGDALVIGGHEVEVVSLPPLTDAGETSRVSAILLISANRGSGRVLLELSGKTLQVRISPQQEALFLLLLKEWRGKADGGFGYIERDEEFALLGRLSPGTEPNNRLHVSRSRLRTWWRRLHKKTPELSQAPIDLLDTERPDHIRLSLRALQVRLDDQPLHGGT